MTFKDNELKALLAEVSADLEKAMASEANELRKAIGDEPGEEDPSAAPDASAPEGSATAADASPAPADGSASPGPEASASPGGDMGPGDGLDPAADAAVDPEALKQEYMKLGPEGIKVHFMACKAAAMEMVGGGGDPAGAPAPSPSPAPMAPPGPGAGPGAPGVMKDERLMSIQPKGKITNGPDRLADIAVTKSEKEIDSLRAQVDLLSKAIHEIVGKPIRKAVTEVEFNGKPELPTTTKLLSKSEVTAKLKVVTSRHDLAKGDRERINQYYDGQVTIEGISDLLK